MKKKYGPQIPTAISSHSSLSLSKRHENLPTPLVNPFLKSLIPLLNHRSLLKVSELHGVTSRETPRVSAQIFWMDLSLKILGGDISGIFE